tara:strand:- start:860 stop:1342 length:483 start_codon:yes stop_codon:yes gene_type:complete
MKKIVPFILLLISISIISFVLGRSNYGITGFSIADFQNEIEIKSPNNYIKDSKIKIFKNKVSIYVNDTYKANFDNTHSMEPTIDQYSTGIEIEPKSKEDIHVGDIISYTNDDNITIIHRVVFIGNDPDWYVITKGDNNPQNDPGKIRYSEINRILIGILY